MSSIEVNDFKPELVGRGQWHVIHMLSARADTLEKRERVCWVIEIIVRNLICKICWEHANTYLSTNPPDRFKHDYLLFFKWGYEFHKSANIHAGKNSPPFDDVRKFYFENTEKCTQECGNVPEKEVKNYID